MSQWTIKFLASGVLVTAAAVMRVHATEGSRYFVTFLLITLKERGFRNKNCLDMNEKLRGYV